MSERRKWQLNHSCSLAKLIRRLDSLHSELVWHVGTPVYAVCGRSGRLEWSGSAQVMNVGAHEVRWSVRMVLCV